MWIFFLEIIWAALGLIGRTATHLTAPDSQLPPNASRGAAWAGLGIGIVLLLSAVGFGIAASVEAAKPHGEYGTINGIPVTRADFDACGGRIPDGCPGGGNMMFLKYNQLRRARG